MLRISCVRPIERCGPVPCMSAMRLYIPEIGTVYMANGRLPRTTAMPLNISTKQLVPSLPWYPLDGVYHPRRVMRLAAQDWAAML
jgi:hypothetical protein